MSLLATLRRAATDPRVRQAARVLATAVAARLLDKGRRGGRSRTTVPVVRPNGGLLRRPGVDGVRTTTDATFDRLVAFEGFSPTWYRNGEADRWTIGYGTTEGVVAGLTREAVPGPITEAEARGWMERVLAEVVEPAVERAVTVEVAPWQFDALVLFTYNVGGGALRRSTLLRKLNAGDVDGAAAEFDRWVHSGTTRLAGLARRRAFERRLFEGNVA